MRRTRADHLKSPHSIDAENALKRLGVLRVPIARARKTGHACVVDQRIDPAPSVNRCFGQGLAIRILGNVRSDQQGLGTRLLAGALRLKRLGFAA